MDFGFDAAPHSRAAGGRPRGKTRPPDSSRRQQRRQHEQQQQQMRMPKASKTTKMAPATAHAAMDTSQTPTPLALASVHDAKKFAQVHGVGALAAQPESDVDGGFHGRRVVVHCAAHAAAARPATHAARNSMEAVGCGGREER